MSFKVTKTKKVKHNSLRDIANHYGIDISLLDNRARLLEKLENHLNNQSDQWTEYKIETEE